MDMIRISSKMQRIEQSAFAVSGLQKLQVLASISPSLSQDGDSNPKT
jgi:hypothetical protein